MKTSLIVLALLASVSASAAEYSVVYLAGTKEVSVNEALLRAMRGEQVSKCVAVEAKPSKSGSSIGLRNVKKPKASE